MKNKYSLTKEQNIFLAKKQLVQSIYSGAKIEGLSVTFPETQTILDGINVGSVPLDEIETILNLRNAWNYTLTHIDEPFNLDFACQINNEVARNESLEWGKLRTGRVGIGGTDYIPPIPEKNQVMSDIQKILSVGSATDQAIGYFLYGCRSQLFWDGNKRTSSICANKILISAGAGILTIPENALVEFNQKLTSFYETNNPADISEFLYDKCISGLDFESVQQMPEKEKMALQEENPIQSFCEKWVQQHSQTENQSNMDLDTDDEIDL